MPWLFRSVGLRLELRCESLAVLQAITTPATALQSFLTELTGGQFSSVRDVEGDPTSCCGQLLSELQPQQSGSARRDGRNTFSARGDSAGRVQLRGLDDLEPEHPSAGAVAMQPIESTLTLLRRWRGIKGA